MEGQRERHEGEKEGNEVNGNILEDTMSVTDVQHVNIRRAMQPRGRWSKALWFQSRGPEHQRERRSEPKE